MTSRVADCVGTPEVGHLAHFSGVITTGTLPGESGGWWFRGPDVDRSDCPVHVTKEKTGRPLDFFQHQAHLHAGCTCNGLGTPPCSSKCPGPRPDKGFTLLFEALPMEFAPQHADSGDLALGGGACQPVQAGAGALCHRRPGGSRLDLCPPTAGLRHHVHGLRPAPGGLRHRWPRLMDGRTLRGATQGSPGRRGAGGVGHLRRGPRLPLRGESERAPGRDHRRLLPHVWAPSSAAP